jgi:NACHT domain
MPDGLVDQREIATKLSQRAIDRIITIGEKAIKEYWGRYKNRDASTYADYLVRKGVQANAVRNFIYDRKSASLYDIYVPATIADRGGQYTGDDLLLRLCAPEENPRKRAARCLAIVGNAGTGKSLFLKHAFFKIQKIDANKIPVLIEVRTFNRLPLADLETRIYEDFGATGTAVIREQIVNGLQSGLFAILLDGMDELKGPVQKHYEAALKKICLMPGPYLQSADPEDAVLG